ncbi:MAG: restriction endonuclease, partial [Acidobacteriota bacterium]
MNDHAVEEKRRPEDGTTERPVATGTQHPLPFHLLDADAFESLCLWLLAEDGFSEVRKLGGAGDGGVDVEAVDAQGRLTIAQCKLYLPTTSFTKAQVAKELDKILGRDRLPDRYLLMITRGVSPQAWAEMQTKSDGRFSVHYWDLTELDRRARRADRSTLERFFNLQFHLAETSASPLIGVPAQPSTYFVGRDRELAQLEERLSGSSVTLCASLEGGAGFGKTELALHLVHRLAAAAAFPGGIYWLSAENPDLVPVWGSLANALGEPEGTAEEKASRLVRRLSRERERILLVLDNVEDWKTPPGPLPTGPHLRVIATSRRRRLGGSQFEHVTLNGLETPAANDLLKRIAGDAVADAPGFGALVDQLDGHPLALELAGAYLSEFPLETPADYLDHLKSGAPADEAVVEGVRYGRTVEKTLLTIWTRLDENTRKNWLLAAQFVPEPVAPL